MPATSSDFEWRFGDDFPEDRTADKQPGQRAWRRWLPLLLVLLVVGSGAYIWWRGRQRNLTQAESQVQQVARLELRALAEGDSELYLSLQDPADRSWKKAQSTYLDTRGLPLPLQDLSSSISTTVDSTRVVGNRARVEVVHTATLPCGEEATFRAIRFYRYTSDGRWLHTKVEPGYAGRKVTFVLGDVEIAAFDEDAVWIEPLTPDLAAVPYRFCNLSACEQYRLLKLRLATDLEEARAMAKTLGVDTTFRLSLAANLEEAAEPDDAVLPAPFLVGTPRNDPARAVWEARLGHFVVDYLIAREIGPRPADEHDGELFEERLRAWFKAELEVTEPVSPDLELVRDALDDQAWIPLWRLWEIESGDQDRPLAAAEIDLLLAFIEEELGPSAVAELLHPLRETNSTEQLLNHVPWAELLHSVREASRSEQLLNPVPWPARSSVELQFPAYVRERTATATDDLSAFASYQLLIGCSEEARAFRASELWGWRLGSAEPVLLSAQPSDEALVPVSWSPDGTQLLLRRQSPSAPGFFLLQSGSGAIKRMVLPDGAAPFLSSLGPSGWSPDGSRLAYRVGFSSSPGSVDIEYRIVDFETGDEITLDGRFIAWSPDGSTLLYAQPSGSESESEAWLSEVAVHDLFLAQGDGTVLRRIGGGYAAAWSPDGEQIATISAEQALMVYDLATGSSTTLLDQDALRQTVGFTPMVSAASDRPFRLAWSPDGEWVAVGATQHSDEGSPEGAVLLARAEEHRLLRRQPGDIRGLTWAPNGQSVLLFAYHGDQLWTSIIELDGSLLLREENAMVTWSSDGRHLALTRFGEEGVNLEILDVGSGQRQEFDAPGTCWPPIWNPGSLQQETAP